MESSDVVCSIMIAVADITKLKQMENNLVANADRLMGVINNSPIVVWNQDRELRYIWIYNPHPGFVAKEVLGKKDEELLPARDAAKLTNIKQQVLDTGVGMRENVRTTIQGKPYEYDLVVEPMLDSNSNIIGISCASMEITK